MAHCERLYYPHCLLSTLATPLIYIIFLYNNIVHYNIIEYILIDSKPVYRH